MTDQDDRRWLITGGFLAAIPLVVSGSHVPEGESVEAMPVAAHEAALAALEALHVGFRERHLEVKGDGDWEQMVKTVLLLIDQQQPLFERCEELGQRLKTQAAALAAAKQQTEGYWHAGYLSGEKVGFESGVAAARHVDEAMVERAAEAIYMEPDEFHRGRPEGVTWESLLSYGGRSPGNRDHPLADEYRRIARATLLAARTSEPGGDTVSEHTHSERSSEQCADCGMFVDFHTHDCPRVQTKAWNPGEGVMATPEWELAEDQRLNEMDDAQLLYLHAAVEVTLDGRGYVKDAERAGGWCRSLS